MTDERDEFSDKTTVVTRNQRSRFGPDGILRQTVIPGTEFTDEEAQETLAVHSKQIEGKKLRILVDTRTVPVTASEARLSYSQPQTDKLVSAVALWIVSPSKRVFGNIALGLSRAAVPVKFFTSEEEALTWLRTFGV